MTLDDLFAPAFQLAESYAGQSFAWRGQEYACAAGPLESQEDFEAAGKRRRLVVAIEATLEQFQGVLPQERDAIVYQGHQLSIRSLATDGGHLRIAAATVAQ